MILLARSWRELTARELVRLNFLFESYQRIYLEDNESNRYILDYIERGEGPFLSAGRFESPASRVKSLARKSWVVFCSG